MEMGSSGGTAHPEERRRVRVRAAGVPMRRNLHFVLLFLLARFLPPRAAAATSAPASSVPPTRPGVVRPPGGFGHDRGDDGGGADPSMGTNSNVGDYGEVRWGDGRQGEGREGWEAAPPPPPADGDGVSSVGGAEGAEDGGGREAVTVNYDSIALTLRMACETNRRLRRSSMESRRILSSAVIEDAGDRVLKRHPFVGATRVHQQQGQQQQGPQQQGQGTQLVSRNIHQQQQHQQQQYQLHHPPSPYGSAPQPPPPPFEGGQQQQLLPPPPVFRIARSSGELPNPSPPKRLTVFHAAEPRKPIVKKKHKKKKKKRSNKKTENEEGEEERQEEEAEVVSIIQRRGVERWGPSLPTFLSQLVEALDCPPICLAVAILYLDRSTSVNTVRRYGVDPCPYVEPRTVHRLVLTAVVLACRVMNGGATTSMGATATSTAYYAERLSRFGVGERQLVAMESTMLDALGVESTAVDPSRVEGLVRAWSAAFVSRPGSGTSFSWSTASPEASSTTSREASQAAADAVPRDWGEMMNGDHPPEGPPGGGMG